MVDSKSKKRLAVVTVILLIGIIYMVYSLMANGSTSSLSYYKKIGEITADRSYVGKTVRVGGEILKGSINQQGHKYTFKIFDKDKQLTIIYTGQLPQTFGAGVTAIADGKMISQTTLQADTVITQCPSKYKSKKIGGN